MPDANRRPRPRTAPWRSPWLLMGGSALLAWAILGVGFRILYDSVIPEVALLVLSGFVLGLSNTPTRAGIALVGLVLGMVLSEKVFPVPAPAEHIAQYGPPPPATWKDFVLVPGFPSVGIVAGMVFRKLLALVP
jgi:hypothetical protein